MLIGYYITCDDAECLPCFERSGGVSAWLKRGGFESWPEPLAIEDSTESDSPTHCHACGIVLEHDLTDAGLDYVAEAIGSGFTEGKQNPVTVQWIDAYEEALDDATMPQADGVKLTDACALYRLLPHDDAWLLTPTLRKYAQLAGWCE